MSKAKTGIKRPDVAKRNRQNMGKIDRAGERNPMFGKHHTKETREKISVSKRS